MKNINNVRRNNLRNNKRIKNLPKYDIGKIKIDSGRQTNYGIDTTGFESIPGLDVSQAANAAKASILPTSLSTLSSNTSSILSNFSQNYVTKAAAQAANANLLRNAGYTFGEGGKYATQSLAENAFKEAGNTGLQKAGFNAIGKAAGLVTSAVNLGQLGTGLYDQWNSAPTSQQLLESSGKIRQSKNGVIYDSYAGFDDDSFQKLFNAQNTRSTINNAINAASAGFGVGSFLGGPVSGIIAGLGAGIVGLGASIFAGDRARKEYNENKKGTLLAQTGYNTQNESVAGSQGARINYNNRSYTPYGFTYNLGKSWSADGDMPGKTKSLVGKGESIINFQEGKAALVDKGTKGVDNQPSSVTPGDSNAIAGNLIDPMTNKSYADQAAPYTKIVEKMNDILENTDSNTKTGKLNSMLAQRAKDNAFKNLEDIIYRQGLHQQALAQLNNKPNTYNKGKCVAKYDPGKTGDLFRNVGAHLLSGIFPIMQYFDYKGATPQARPSYAANVTAPVGAALMASRYDDPYEDEQVIKKANREGLYTINHSPLSQGQRMAMMAAQNANYMNALADRRAKSRLVNNQYAKENADYLYKSGSDDQRIRFASNAQYNQDLQEAVAKRQLGMETALKGMQSEWQAFAQDMQKYDWFREAMAFNDKQLKLWNDQNDLEWLKARQGWGDNNRGTAFTNYTIPGQSGLIFNRFGQTGYYDSDKNQIIRVPGGLVYDENGRIIGGRV